MSSHMDFIKEQLYALTAIPSPSALQRKRQIICYPN